MLSPPPLLPSFPLALLLILSVPGVVAAAPPSATPESTTPDVDPVLARVGSWTLTRAELESELARRANGRPGAFEDAAARRLVLDELIERQIVVEAALAAGYAEDAAVRRAFEDLMVQKYRQDHLETRLAEIEVTQDEIESFYSENRELYRLPPRRAAALLKLPARTEPERAEAERVRARALELPVEPPHFGALAAEVSYDQATRYRGGDMGELVPGRQYQWPEEVTAAVSRLEEVGQVSPLVEANGFLWLVRLTEAEDVTYRSLDQVAPTIRHELHRQKSQAVRAELLSELRGHTEIEISEVVLEAVAPPPEVVPPPLPDRGDDSEP